MAGEQLVFRLKASQKQKTVAVVEEELNSVSERVAADDFSHADSETLKQTTNQVIPQMKKF